MCTFVSQTETFSVKLRVTKRIMEPKLVNVPPDEMLVAENCYSIDLDEADLACVAMTAIERLVMLVRTIARLRCAAIRFCEPI